MSESGKKGVYVVLFGDTNTSFSRESSPRRPFLQPDGDLTEQFPERYA